MTNFEIVGANRQYGSLTKEEAIRQYNKSCERCCYSGRCWRSCDSCAIKVAHGIVMNNFALDELNKEMEAKLIRTKKRLGLA